MVNQFQTEISPLVEELAKEQKLQVVLTFQPGLVAYADPTWIVAFSDEVARRYDAKYEPNGAAAKPGAAPKPAAVKPVVVACCALGFPFPASGPAADIRGCPQD